MSGGGVLVLLKRTGAERYGGLDQSEPTSKPNTSGPAGGAGNPRSDSSRLKLPEPLVHRPERLTSARAYVHTPAA